MSTTRITQRHDGRAARCRRYSSASAGSPRARSSCRPVGTSTGRPTPRPAPPTPCGFAPIARCQRAVRPQRRATASAGSARPTRPCSSMLDQVRRARELALQGASTGSTGQTRARPWRRRGADQIRAGLLDEANTQHLGRPALRRRRPPAPRRTTTPAPSSGVANAINRDRRGDVSVAVNVDRPDSASAPAATTSSPMLDAARRPPCAPVTRRPSTTSLDDLARPVSD